MKNVLTMLALVIAAGCAATTSTAERNKAIVEGKIRQEWSEFDEQSAKRELGLLPEAEAPAAR
jgi:hypothetical protein